MKHPNVVAAIGTVISLIVAGAVSFGLAHLGEPQSEWFWCEILNVIDCQPER